MPHKHDKNEKPVWRSLHLSKMWAAA